MLSLSISSFASFSVSGHQLLDSSGQPFVMRGINLPHAWYPQRTSQAIKDIANMHANTVRVVLSSGDYWQYNDANDVANVLQQLKENQLIAVLEVHDTLGYPENVNAIDLDKAVDYWIELYSVLKGQEDYVIINIGNEPIGNNQPSSLWIDAHVNAIRRLRDAGFEHTLMVDAPNWGQDFDKIMLNNAAAVANSDKLRNTIFSVHMYEVYQTNRDVSNYINTFRISQGYPLIIGEFSTHSIHGIPVAADSIMILANSLNMGYLGWSWSGNTGTDSAHLLDIVADFDHSNLTPWGELLVHSDYGLKQTAQKASIFLTENDSPASPEKVRTITLTGSLSMTLFLFLSLVIAMGLKTQLKRKALNNTQQ